MPGILGKKIIACSVTPEKQDSTEIISVELTEIISAGPTEIISVWGNKVKILSAR
jgi:hypothetical protein